jgi:hypothetical protein
VGGVHVVGVVVGGGVTELVDDDGFAVVGRLEVGSNDVGGTVVAVAGGEGLEDVGSLVAVVVESAAHRQSPNREFHFNGSSIGQLHLQSDAEAHVPLHEPSYIEVQLLP